MRHQKPWTVMRSSQRQAGDDVVNHLAAPARKPLELAGAAVIGQLQGHNCQPSPHWNAWSRGDPCTSCPVSCGGIQLEMLESVVADGSTYLLSSVGQWSCNCDAYIRSGRNPSATSSSLQNC